MRIAHSPAILALVCGLLAGCGEDGGVGRNGGDPDAATDTGGDGSTAQPDLTGTCQDDDGDGRGENCELGFDCNDASTSVHEGATELCDGVDNNCDDFVDEGCPCLSGSIQACYTGADGTVGIGRCQGGFSLCEDDVWGSCQSQTLPQDERCDTLDNDCDGQADEGLTNACAACGSVPAESCGDGLDNDCDGVIDPTSAGCSCDGRTRQPCYGGPPQTLGVGVCRGGTFDCVDGEWGRCRGHVLPTTEVCDGVDNDCDGLIDEGLTNACGDCGVPTPREVCDGDDNDCDGLTDEGLVLTCGLCSAVGLEEACDDGLDNDCDGQVDEGCPCIGDPACYPGPPALRGVGACAQGTRSCDPSGEFWGACTGYGLPQPEICDGIDNDCDGLTDISPRGCNLCQENFEECNGEDDDCDGLVDEYLVNACGQCVDTVIPEEQCGPSCCNGEDDDCDGLVDEGLVNACGTCDESCYVFEWSVPEGNLDEGERNGLADDLSEGLRLGVQPFVYPYLWVANSGEATVTKINTETFQNVGTYPVGTSPSRTAVDLDGNVWVANRAFGAQGSVTKIQAEDCEGNACVLFTRNIGAVNHIPRGLAVDENNFVWVGTYTGRQLFQLEPENGDTENTYDVSVQIYGLAVDSEGTIWMASIDGSLGAFDIAEQREVPGSPWTIPTCSSPYGIAIDGEGDVWLGNWSCNNIARFDVSGRTFQTFTPGSFNAVRGVAVDDLGFIWTVATDSDSLGRFNPGTGQWMTFATCDQPMGVGVTASGTIWTPCWNSQVRYFDQTGANLGNVTAGANPYSYSDMTGFQLRTFTARQGTWTVTYDCGYPVCSFDSVSWDADIPVGTNVRVRGRTSSDQANWSPRAGYFDVTPADFSGLPDGRYFELEVSLTTTDRDISPLVRSIQVSWQRP